MDRPGIRSQKARHPVSFDGPGATIPIGVVVPFDFNLDWEYWSYLPPDVALHFTRTPQLREGVGIRLARGVSRPSMVTKATRSLAAVDPAAVLYACSSGSFVDGIEGERATCEAMLAGGAPAAVTTAGATVDALRMTGMQRIAVVTPYTATLTVRFVHFLQDAGFDVVSAHHLGLADGISRLSKRSIADLVRTADGDEADAVVLSCTALRTWGLVRELEGELGRPVFTSNQVSLWGVLLAAGVLGRGTGQPGSSWAMGGADPALSTQMLLRAVDPAAAHGAA